MSDTKKKTPKPMSKTELLNSLDPTDHTFKIVKGKRIRLNARELRILSDNKKSNFRGIFTGGLPSALPKLSRKNWSQIRLHSSKGTKIDWGSMKVTMPGGGTRQLLSSELLLLKSFPFLKKGESNASFQARVEQWEGATGIAYPLKGKSGIGNTYQTDESKSLAGLPRIYGLDGPKDYTGQDHNWPGIIRDLQFQRNYKPDKLPDYGLDGPIPINQAEIEKNKAKLRLESTVGKPLPTNDQETATAEIQATVKDGGLPINSAKDLELNNRAAGQPKVEKKSPQPPLLKSDVFTLDKDNNPLGVMTRARRRRWEANNQDLMRKNMERLKIANRTYTDRGETLRIGSG